MLMITHLFLMPKWQRKWKWTAIWVLYDIQVKLWSV